MPGGRKLGQPPPIPEGVTIKLVDEPPSLLPLTTERRKRRHEGHRILASLNRRTVWHFSATFEEQAVGIQLPLAVELAVTHCDPATRGNSATGRTKPATLETGLVVQVPEYLEQGVRIKVDTRTGEFLSRASE